MRAILEEQAAGGKRGGGEGGGGGGGASDYSPSRALRGFTDSFGDSFGAAAAAEAAREDASVQGAPTDTPQALATLGAMRKKGGAAMESWRSHLAGEVRSRLATHRPPEGSGRGGRRVRNQKRALPLHDPDEYDEGGEGLEGKEEEEVVEEEEEAKEEDEAEEVESATVQGGMDPGDARLTRESTRASKAKRPPPTEGLLIEDVRPGAEAEAEPEPLALARDASFARPTEPLSLRQLVDADDELGEMGGDDRKGLD